MYKYIYADISSHILPTISKDLLSAVLSERLIVQFAEI